MSSVVIGIITMAIMIILILLGVHVGIALGLMSVLGIMLAKGDLNIGVKLLGTTSFQGIRDYFFGVIPLFVLMGLFSNQSGISEDLYRTFHVLFRKIRGGLGMATVGANAIFATITGVSVASAAVFSKIAVGPMTRLNYDKKFALGTVAGSSVLGMLIPPSLLFIVYGMLSEESVGRLFMAGVIPGILLAVVYCIGIYLMATFKPSLIGGKESLVVKKFDKEDLVTVFKSWPIFVLVVLILGGIYGGLFTPTEAGAVGAFGALLLAVFKGKLNLKNFWSVIVETGYTATSVLFLLITAQMYSRMLSLTGVLSTIEQFINSLALPPILIIIIFLLILLILGCVLDSTSILLITMPLMLPVVKMFGYDLIWFGVLAVIVVEMGLLTPPFGMVVYSIKAALGKEANIADIFRGSFPFLIMMMLVIVLLIIFPQLSTWLPELMTKR